MKKIITLLALIIIMVYAHSAASHYLDGTWLKTPTMASLSLLIVIHALVFAFDIYAHLKGFDKNEK
tara:strand:+ start:1155 stop:1352 length:198 start_codon:yes stop_codon:yes gene_type:complete